MADLRAAAHPPVSPTRAHSLSLLVALQSLVSHRAAADVLSLRVFARACRVVARASLVCLQISNPDKNVKAVRAFMVLAVIVGALASVVAIAWVFGKLPPKASFLPVSLLVLSGETRPLAAVLMSRIFA